MSYSYRSIIDGGADSDYIYYSASIVAAQQADSTQIGASPAVRFNETRAAPIIRDAALYDFSIIRFAMNGPNKNLPLFIPLIQLNGYNGASAQSNPYLTIYSTAIAYQRTWYYTSISGAVAQKTFTITPPSTSVIYRPETVNSEIAPVPVAPVAPVAGFTKQNISTRFYWVYTYKHWCDLVNEALLNAMSAAFAQFLSEWTNTTDINQTASPFPYAGATFAERFANFLAAHDAPFLKYDEESKLFEIYGDTRAFNISGQLDGSADVFGQKRGVQLAVPAFVPPAAPVAPTVAVAASAPYLRLFMNSNLFGLLTNFNNTYYGASSTTALYWPIGAAPVPISSGGNPLISFEYTNEILFKNQQYTNILNNNPTLQNVASTPPPTYNPLFLIPTAKQNLYWISKPDYNSTNSLWSPCSGIVFTSTLLPVKNEYVAKTLSLGQNNVSDSTGSAAGFQPIISDFVVDQQQEKAEGWRDFVLYEPVAEYKMCSLTASHEEIRNLDIQVFWRYRLTGELIPLTLFNCSDVTVKMMFRKIGV
jgi:hypothetical protein